MAPCAGTGRRLPGSIAFLGPALGTHTGWVTTQGEVLAGLFAAQGERVMVSSTHLNPVVRAVAHARDLVRWRHDVSVVVVSVFSGRAFALADESLALARGLGIPAVAWLHGGSLPDFAREHPRWVRRALRRADAVVAPTAFLARWSGTFVPGTQVIPNVLDLGAYRFRIRSPLQPRLLWMRTFQELYDPSSAVRMLRELRARGVDATLTMAGQDKGLLGPTRDLACQLAVDGSITFPGFVAGEAKADLLDRHDIFVNTNVVDNAPVTVLEAAASGLVVVSTDSGGIPDLLADGEAARLAPPRDPGALADAVAEVLAEPDLAVRLAGTARTVAERSEWVVVRQQWMDLFHGLLDGQWTESSQ